MKNLKVLAVLALIPLFGFSQSIFDQYADMDNVGTVVVSKGMINLVTKLSDLSDDKEAEEFAEVAKGIDGIKVFITEDKGVSASMAGTVKKYLKSSSMEELMRVKDKDVNVKFYIKTGKDEDHV